MAEIEKLRSGLLKICAWTKQIEVDGRWVPIDEFLRDFLQLRLTHGISETGIALSEGQPAQAAKTVRPRQGFD